MVLVLLVILDQYLLAAKFKEMVIPSYNFIVSRIPEPVKHYMLILVLPAMLLCKVET